jgi:hypothetical protein
MSKHTTFIIYHPGEPAAGIAHYDDRVTIECASGDFGGESLAEFEQFMAHALGQWYDGAKVTPLNSIRSNRTKEHQHSIDQEA